MRILFLLLCALVLGLQYRLWFSAGSWAQIVSLEKSLLEQAEVNHQLAARNRELEVEIHELKTGLDAVEGRARSELGMVVEGETFYLIIDD